MWKDVPGYEGLYVIDEDSNIMNLLSNKVLTQTLNIYGYYKINLRKDEEVRTFLVHRLVALTFIDNPMNKPQVNHIDEDSKNNHVSNLEWCTPKENCNHGTRIERIRNLIDYKKVSEKTSKPIIQMNKDGKEIKIWESISSCNKETGFDKSNIVKCLKGKAKTSYGYQWKYKTIS